MQEDPNKDTKSRTEKIIFAFQNHKYFAILVAACIGIIGLSALTNSIASIRQHFGLIPKPIEAVRFSEDDFDRQANSRFSFSFPYPKTWDRFDPENADGNRYVDPVNPDVQCSFWGNLSISSSNLWESVDQSLSMASEEPGFELISNVESGRHQVTWMNIDGEIQEIREQVEGRRVVYSSRPKGKASVVFMHLFLHTGDREIHALCQAPKALFPAYQSLFLALLAEVRVLQYSN